MKLKIPTLLSIMLTLSGCAQQRIWQYLPNTYQQTQKTNKTIAVSVFEERLVDLGISKIYTGIAFIPLVPFSKSHISWAGRTVASTQQEKPIGTCIRQADGGEILIFNPPISFSHALYKDIEETNMFKDVIYVCNEKSMQRKTDYVIKGYVTDVSVDLIFFSYGIGPVAMLTGIPYIFGAPLTRSTTNLGLELQLVRVSDNYVLFKKAYNKKSQPVYIGLYVANSSFLYPEMSASIFKEFVSEIIPIIQKENQNKSVK